MRVAPLGISIPADLAPAPLRRDPFTIGYFARVAPEKGLHLLAEAYTIMRRQLGLPPSRLRAAGFRGADQRSYFDGIVRKLESAGLGGEFEYRGAPDRAGKFAYLQTLDVFCVPSPYHEPKGLYLLEAMAAGVPVVAPAHGAFPELITATDAGFVTAPGRGTRPISRTRSCRCGGIPTRRRITAAAVMRMCGSGLRSSTWPSASRRCTERRPDRR